ncbi:ribosomal protein S18-alanine N-acetyltransferase [Legionella impletisoli]|uniref:Ribosomal-protein-alanine acetyltransferase n=1 Tax=Legionella impletisoli TaxID=343510 RepID=A0A917JP75_9GAMM|nr:ribosomal protein S18-alanine N-acetyltransferase [Legionella impletisoli]GGI77930.1 ribosomal-protein-alanine acetyltransferase [Legionella impletisoli]
MNNENRSLNTNAHFQLRPMELGDIDQVYAIESTAHKTPWCRKVIHDCILIGYHGRVLEIIHNSTLLIVAYTISRIEDSECHILNLCVAPSFQGQGYGRLILKDLLESLNKYSNLKQTSLEVRLSNQKAIRLYEQMGFRMIGIKEAYYKDEDGFEDAAVYQKWL